MKILFIHAKINFDNMEPLGLISLATTLKTFGHTVKIIDIFPENNAYWLNIAKGFSPDLVGYSFETPGYSRIKEVHSILRSEIPDAIYCAGGIHPTVLPEATLRELSLHFIVYGEAEASFPAIVSRLESSHDLSGCYGVAFIKNDTYIQTEPAAFIDNLDSLPIADRSLLVDCEFYFNPPGNIRGLVNSRCANLITSRGCPYSCIFCESKIVMGRKHRQRSPHHVVNEIAYLHAAYGIKAVYFVDDIFTLNNEWVDTFCVLLKRLPFSLRWGCQSRADTLNEAMLYTMRLAGCCQIDLGVESGDPAVLKEIRKNETIEQFVEAANLIHKNGIRLLCSFVVGAPGESWDSITKTRHLIRRMKPSICQYFTLVPYPGSELYRKAETHGWLGNVTFNHQGSQKQFETGFLTCGLSSDDQVKARKKLHRETFLRDHCNLIIGWFFLPKWLFLWVWVAVQNLFFVGALLRGIKEGNPALVMLKAYESFNKHLLVSVRKKNRGNHTGE